MLGLIAVFFASELIVEIQWRWYASGARARGVKLTVAELNIAAVPDAENFANQAIFREVATMGREGPRYKFLAALDSPSPKMPYSRSAPDGAEWLKPVDFAGWRASVLAAKWMEDSVPNESPAAGVLRGMKACEPELSELRAARNRIACNYPGDWTQAKNRPDQESAVMLLRFVLHLRIIACCEERDRVEAVESLRDLWRLARSVEKEPALLANLVWADVTQKSLEGIRRGLDARVFTDEDLAEFEQVLASVSARKRMAWALETERVFVNTATERMMDGRFGHETEQFVSLFETQSPKHRVIHALSLTRGYWRRHQVESNKAMDLAGTPDVGTEWHPAEFAEMDPAVSKGWLSEYFTPFVQEPSGLRYHIRNAARTDAALRAVRIQCALERYRLTHSAFPEKLDQLVPAFLPAQLRDPFSDGLFHYQRTGSGYLVYSAGANGRDDGGKPGKKGDDWREKPDLVWPYPAVLPLK